MVLDPHLIPGFEIVDRLASGGMAEVFRARRESDDLEVALKVMSLADIDPEFRPAERFQREGELLERLNHPSLPRLYGYGVTDRELGWLAQELVRGRPLSEYVGHPVVELLPIFIQIAEGLQAVAQEGIVHRDISPDNILVEERHGRLRARLIDFGVAKDLLAGAESGNLTRHGAFIGKLAYASPEQLIGPPKGETLDFRSDVYSAGMTFYELLAGRRAIEGESLPELVDAHRKGSFPPLVLSAGTGVSAPRLVALVTRMIARGRDDRPQSWEEVLAELWHSREEVSPLSETLARKRGTRSGGLEPTVALAVPQNLSRSLSREVLTGRIVLSLGAAAFLASVVFAILFLRRDRSAATSAAIASGPAAAATAPAIVAPVAIATAIPPAATAPTRTGTTMPPVIAVSTVKNIVSPTAQPAREHTTHKTPAPVLRGTLEIALSPAGELDEIRDAAGRSAGSRQPLPARLELPAGRYTVRLAARGLDCLKTVSVTVRAGRTTSVKESCIEIK